MLQLKKRLSLLLKKQLKLNLIIDPCKATDFTDLYICEACGFFYC
jgi:hypothetical protein